MQLHQINAQYDALQDRLLLRLSTSEAREYRLWLTRRITGLLWPGLFRLLQDNAALRRQASAETQQALLGFQHEAALAQSDFSQPFDADRLQPATPEPLLVRRVRMRRNGELYSLLFLPPQGEGLQVQLPERMVHALARLIAGAVKRADWGLAPPSAVRAPAWPADRRLN